MSQVGHIPHPSVHSVRCPDTNRMHCVIAFSLRTIHRYCHIQIQYAATAARTEHFATRFLLVPGHNQPNVYGHRPRQYRQRWRQQCRSHWQHERRIAGPPPRIDDRLRHGLGATEPASAATDAAAAAAATATAAIAFGPIDPPAAPQGPQPIERRRAAAARIVEPLGGRRRFAWFQCPNAGCHHGDQQSSGQRLQRHG